MSLAPTLAPRVARFALVIALVACGGRSSEPVAVPPPALPADAGPAPDAAVATVDAGPTLTEAEARALLARRFRGAGLRIRQDVPVGGVTLDGADPQARVGYEYVAEGDPDGAPNADEWTILVVEATDLAHLTAQADAFLSRLGSSESGQ